MRIPVAETLARIVGPLPGQREAVTARVMAMAVGLIACALSLYFGFQGKTLMNRPMGNDFVQFYAAGRILNQDQPARIYDTAYLAQLEHEALPEMAPTQVLPFAYPPAVGQPFRALALLPYRWAYCAWLAFSMAVYATGLLLLFRKRVFGNYRRTAILLSVSTPVYLFETLIGGQISVMTFFAVALFVYCFENRWLALAGLALGFASYKPSLIAVPAAVMILGGCWRMLAGLGTSAALMVLATVATAGLNGLWLWLIRLRAFSDLATSSDSALRRIKYVDLNSFFAILLGGNPVARVAAATTISTAFAVLAWSWWQSRRQQSHEVQRYLWAATLAWTLVINVYVGIYDAILLVPAAALVARSSASRGKPEQVELQAWLTLLWVASWFTQAMAVGLRMQILTVVIAGFGYWALRLAEGSAEWVPFHSQEATGTQFSMGQHGNGGFKELLRTASLLCPRK